MFIQSSLQFESIGAFNHNKPERPQVLVLEQFECRPDDFTEEGVNANRDFVLLSADLDSLASVSSFDESNFDWPGTHHRQLPPLRIYNHILAVADSLGPIQPEASGEDVAVVAPPTFLRFAATHKHQALFDVLADIFELFTFALVAYLLDLAFIRLFLLRIVNAGLFELAAEAVIRAVPGRLLLSHMLLYCLTLFPVLLQQ